MTPTAMTAAALTPNPPDRRQAMPVVANLQYLRALAAIMVVLFHVCEHYGLSFYAGNAGVDLFFVISGFVMWFTTCEKPLTPSGFFIRRLLRLVPNYWLATLAIALAIALKPQFFWKVVLTPAALLQSLFFIPYGLAGTESPVLIQGWTLNLELFFYLLFAVALFCRPSRRLWLLTCSLAVLSATGLFVTPVNLIAAAYTSPLLLEFLAGIWLAVFYRQGRLEWPKRGAVLGIAGLAALALAPLYVNDQLPRLLIFGLPALSIVTGALTLESRHIKLSLPALLGNASYSIYLWHNLLLVVIDAIALRLSLAHSPFSIGIVLLLTLAASTAMYFLIEKPLLRIKPKWLRS